jgi:hypothetical protein
MNQGMNKTLTIALSLALCFATTVAYGHHGPTTTTIAAAAKKQAAVPFSHGKHATLAKSCDACHHLDKGLTKETDKSVKKCSACHLDPKAGVPSMRETSLQKNPMHALCISCHKEQKKGPTGCTGCHVKK